MRSMICMLPGQGRARLRIRGRVGVRVGCLHVAGGRDLADVARAEVADAIDGDEVLLVLGDDVRVGVLRVDQVAVAHLVRVRVRVRVRG